jgi:dTDP-4-amino-4,6-dideoxygalactose transaminase
MMIPLHRPWLGAEEEAAVLRVLRSGRLAGNGSECAALERELQARLRVEHALVLASGTHALELAFRLLDVQHGEVIVPSFTFPSVANAVLGAGGTIRFCEIREPDLNVDLEDARALVGPRTRALVITHYGGHPQVARDFPVPVVEDAAHAFGSTIGDLVCGTLGVFGCLSFHATKNVVAGEGGALISRDREAVRRARIAREKGTNRDDFTAGRIDHYSWVGPGSSLVMPELSAAVARVQLAKADRILQERRRVAALYDERMADLEREGLATVVRPRDGSSSHHVYAVLVPPVLRPHIVRIMRGRGIEVAPHFVPLHSSPYGRRLSPGVHLPTTDRIASSLLRLPIYPGLSPLDVDKIVDGLRAALESSIAV